MITICISASKFNPNNFWNGRWRSVWTCTFSPNGKVQLDGNMKLNVHYYEEGNVQLTTNTNKATTCNGGVRSLHSHMLSASSPLVQYLEQF